MAEELDRHRSCSSTGPDWRESSRSFARREATIWLPASRRISWSASLLLLHGLHPVDAETRVREALHRLERRLEVHRLSLDIVRMAWRAFASSATAADASGHARRDRSSAPVAECAPDLAGVEIEGLAAVSAGADRAGGELTWNLFSSCGAFWNAPKPREGQSGKLANSAALALAAGHGHVVDVEQRRLMCTCRPCYLLFTHPGAAGGQVPLGIRALSAHRSWRSALAMDGLQIPVGMVFYLRNSQIGRCRRFIPVPPGRRNRGLPVETWDEMVQANPVLATLEPDVEALLISRPRDGATQSLDRAGGCVLRTGGPHPASLERLRRR